MKSIKEYLFGKTEFMPAEDYWLPEQQDYIRHEAAKARREERRRLMPYIKALRAVAYGLTFIMALSLIARVGSFARHGGSPGGEILLPFGIIFLIWTIKEAERDSKGDNK